MPMKNILVFAGSNSLDSINKKLATYASNFIDNSRINILDLNDYELPIYSKHLEAENGHPENAKKFIEHIKHADGVILSLAEYNGAYTSVFKNLFDWMSRIEQKIFQNKPMLLMATSPGARGGQSVLGMAADRFPRHEANIVAKFSLPSFEANFSEGRISNSELREQLLLEVEKFKKAI